MSQPADHKPTVLRERLDQLADSVSGGDTLDGTQLYRQGVRRRRRRIAATTALIAVAVVIAGAVLGSAVRPEASPEIGPGPASTTEPDGCVIPTRFESDVESGLLTEEKACEYARAMDGLATPEHSFPGGPSIVVEGQVHEDTVAECRAGTYDSGDSFADLYCNAFLKIAAGALDPTGTCGPPICPEGTPVWIYDEAQLHDLADGHR